MTLKIAETKEIQAKLTKAGLIAYVQAPNQYKNFEIEIQEARQGNRMIITPGKTDIQVFPNPTHSQAIIWADEESRTETRDVSSYIGYGSSGTDRSERLEEIKKQWRRGHNFPMNLPKGTKYKVIDGPNAPTASASNVTGRVQATVPKSELTLLVGKDESAHFVSALPERVKSIHKAHEILRPADVPKGSPRQGEWFFVPATEEELETIENLIKANPLGSIQPHWLDGVSADNRWAWTSTTHTAPTSVLLGSGKKATLFAAGFILDDRRQRGQKSRHEPLWLHDWHRVVHNAEVDMGNAQAETWD